MERKALTTKELLERAKKDLQNLIFNSEANKRNLIALITQYQIELKEQSQ